MPDLESCLSSLWLDVRSAPAVRPVWCIDPPEGRRYKTPTVYILESSVSQPPFSTNDGQLRSVYRLGKTCVLITITRRQCHQTQISCFSLFTMSKTIKVQTNKNQVLQGQCPTKPRGQNSVGRCPRAKSAQNQKTRRDTPNDAKRNLVGRGGLEPPTSRLSGVRSNQLSYRPPRARQPGQAPSRTGATEFGGACRARTGDPLLAKQMLSQLS